MINVDKNPSYPPGFEELKEEEILNKQSKLRQVKYLNNLVEQDHRFIKKITKASLGYKSFHTGWKTIRGVEIMHMIYKGQVQGISKGEIIRQKEFVESLFGIAV